MTPAELLPHFAVPDHDGVFLLVPQGTRPRGTIYDQQVRALNLVTSLFASDDEKYKLRAGDKVAVVGAGIGGLTAACAAARLKAKVHVYEQRRAPISFQRGCSHRLIHPRIYDWPYPGFEKSNAELRVMNWRAGLASVVAGDLVDEWTRERARYSIRFIHDTKVTGVTRHDGAWQLRTEPPNEGNPVDYDLVILAVGFGVEKPLDGHPLRSYWRGDELDDIPLDLHGAPVRYLIAGIGDGALIDVLRARLDGFQHDKLLTEFGLGERALEEVREKLIEIEEEAILLDDAGPRLKDQYSELFIPEALLQRFRNRARPRTEVVLATRSESPFSLKSSTLHRFLLAVLLRAGLVQHHVGELTGARGARPRVTVELSRPPGDPIFYDVVARLGPEPVLGALPDLAPHFAKMPIKVPDPTRQPGDWSALDLHLPAAKAIARNEPAPNVGYYVTDQRGNARIYDRGFRDSDREAFLKIGRALRLVTNLGVAQADARDRYDDGVVLEVRFGGAPISVDDIEEMPPPGVPLACILEGIEYVFVRELASILGKPNVVYTGPAAP